MTIILTFFYIYDTLENGGEEAISMTAEQAKKLKIGCYYTFKVEWQQYDHKMFGSCLGAKFMGINQLSELLGFKTTRREIWLKFTDITEIHKISYLKYYLEIFKARHKLPGVRANKN